MRIGWGMDTYALHAEKCCLVEEDYEVAKGPEFLYLSQRSCTYPFSLAFLYLIILGHHGKQAIL